MPPGSSFTRMLAVAGIVVAGGCSNDIDSLGPAPFPSDPGVYAEGFAPGVRFEAFGGAKVDALSDDPNNRRSGSVGLRVTVPGPGDPSGGYAGGAFIANVPRDLTGFNALTFWAKASTSASLDVGGLGNDNTGTSRYTAQRTGIQLTTGWQRYVIPIPLASKLSQEAGLFFFAEGPENGAGYDLWFDDIQFEKLTSIQNPRPAIASATVTGEAGGTLQLTGTTVTFEVDGVDQTVSAAPGYFTFTSSNESVATVAEDGTIAIVGAGSSNITARLGATPATGQVTLVATAPPATAAPVPTRLAIDVISLFSNAYTNVPVDTWSAGFDIADVSDVQIAGDDVKKYTNLVFAGIEFVSQQVNASAMTGLHLDIWVQDATQFKVKLVDFGANGVFGGGDDSEHEVTLTPNSNPAVTAGSWSSLDIPLSAFTGLTAKGHLAQMIISGSSSTVYLDNVYFYKGALPPPPPGPTTAAPTPTASAANVISLFSNAYTNAAVDTWSAVWDAADVADVQVAGNDTKEYTNLVFAGIEFTSTPVDASAMTGFHMDIWTPNPTAAASFRVKLVDFGADGTFGGGDDVEHELTFTASSNPALATGSWVALDVPLSAFTGLTTKGHLAQLIISGDLSTLYVDNVYFYTTGGGGTPTAPTTAAPTPTASAANVISLFSNAYTNAAVDTWSAVWDAADVADVQVAGNDTKEYTNLVFAGIEFTSTPVDASAMTGFHMDIWTPNPTAAASFRVKLVDFGADGTFGGGDDVEHELTFTASSNPALATGSWVALDVPLSAFAGLTTRGHLAQMIISGDLSTLFVDNVYFYASGGGTPTGGLVFYDGYDAGVTFVDFGGATNAVSVDATTMNNGRTSLKAIITGSGGFSGGAFVASVPRDLRAFNALTFWAKGSAATSTLKVGIGNNGTSNLFNAEAIGIPLTTTFTKYIIPLPDPSKFTGYDGLFHFADGPNNYTVWFNDIQYENLPSNLVGPPAAALAAWPSLTVAVGTPAQMNPAPNTVNWTVPALPNGGKLTDVAWRWYTLTSSNPSVATVSADGLITGVSGGTANITATLNGLAVPGNAPITVTAPLSTPSNIAATPTVPPGNVISLFSSAYTNVGVDTWRTSWSTCCNELVDPYTISGHDVKQYTLHHFVGIEFGVSTPANIVDATTMTHLHLDVWSPNPASDLEIQLVNDATGSAAVGIYHAGTIATGTWVSLDIPLTSFAGLTGKNKLQQMLLLVPGGATSVVYVDNVYFHN